MIANLEPLCVLWQIWIGIALRYDTFKIVLTGKMEQPFTILVNVIAVKKSFAALRHHGMMPELAVNERQVPKVFAIAESAVLLLVIRLRVLIPEYVEGDEARLCASEQKIAELGFAIRVEAHYLTVNDTAATFQIASQAFAECGEALERVPIARDEPHAIFVGVKQGPEPVPFDLEEPIRIREMAHGREKAAMDGISGATLKRV
jgi:hypothetical protein